MKQFGQTALMLRVVTWAIPVVCFCFFPRLAEAEPSFWHQQTVTFLGTTLNQNRQPIGIVGKLGIAFRKQEGQEVLNVSFSSGPGKFSPFTQVAIQSGIVAAARVAGLDPKTWNIFLKFPNPGVTIYGDSLTAMVSLVVLAMANDNAILLSRVMTGNVTRDGHIGAVGGIPLKIQAAYAEHIRRVIIPEERLPEDNDWQTPFLMQISPVNTVLQAYQILTGLTLPDAENASSLMARNANEK
ncbi:S16 family serine protease [uncultured Nitrospira sp.]|uniref:S16 family serine protease n=1 Tax=uncultured Nitrospira sp. TaxID=157176 RepID=UPI003140670A